MKKLFKKLLAVALVGAMVGFVGCKDYDDDIDALNNRLDGIENNQIKGINDQIASMQSSISSLQSAQSATQAAVETLKATVATLTAKHDADIQDLKGADIELQAQISVLEAAIKALEAKDADLQAQIDSINETMKTMASMSWVEATLEAYATSEEVAAAIGELEAWLGEIGIRLANLESQVTELQILGDEHAKAIDAANAKIEALQAQLDKAVEDLMAWVGEQLSGYITASYFEGYMTEYTAEIVSTLETISNAIEDDYKEYTDEAVKNAVEAFKAQVVATLEEMSNAIEADRARDLEALKEQIVATLEEMSNAIEADRKRDLTALQEAIVAQLEEMSNAIEADRARDIQDALDKVVAQLEETSNAIEHDYKEYADAVVAQLRDDVVNTLMEMSAGIEADMEKLKGVIEENYTAAIEDALAKVVATLEEMSNAIEADRARDLAALKEQVVATLEEMSNAIEADYKKEIAAAIENNNGVLRAEFTDAMAKLSEMLDKFITDTQKQLLAANINIEALMNRIQSIVYVPDYDDHKATVPAILAYEAYQQDPNSRVEYKPWLVGEGEMMMNFRVTPANLAMKVAAVGPKAFNFMLQGVKTRAAAQYGLEVLDVAYNPVVEDGLFTVVAQPKLPLEFYKGQKGYSVSLVLNATNAEVQKKEDNAAAGTATSIMTSYVNLFADTLYLSSIKPGKVVDGDLELVGYKEYTIDWDDTKTKIELLKGYEPYLVMFDRNDNTVHIPYAKAKMMFTLPELVQYVGSNVAFDKSEGKDFEEGLGNFVCADEQEAVCDEVVSLKEPKKEFLGDYLTTEHIYAFMPRVADETDVYAVTKFESDPITTVVKIVKPTRKVYLSPVLYYWWYQDYMSIGADKYEGDLRSFDLEADCSNIVDMTLAEIFEGQGGNAIDVYTTDESGEYTVKTAIKAFINKKATEGEDDEIIAPVRFKNWKFGDNYADAMFKRTDREDIDIEFYVSLNFVGLPEKIEYPMKDQTIAYDATKTIFTANAFDAKAETSPLEDIYALIGADKKENKFFADQNEFVQLVLATDLANDPLTKLNRLATRISGDDEKTKTELTKAEGPFGPLSWYPSSAGLLSPKTADDLFSAFYQIPMADVVTDADVFDFVTTFTTEPGMAIELTGSAAVELPAYRVKHSKTWVAEPNDAIGRPYFYSDVKGLWSTMSLLEQLTSFSTTKIELESAFLLEELVDGTWQPVAKADKPAYVTYDFNIVPDVNEGGMATLVDAGITIDANNVMSYNGMNESVNVLGKLKVNEVVLSKAFKYTNEKNEEIDYTTYRVFKYDPLEEVKDLQTKEQTIYTSESKNEYEYYIWHNLSLKDKRGAELFANDPAMYNYGTTKTDVWNMGGVEFKESPTVYFGIDKTYAPEGWTNLSGVQIGTPKAFYVDTNEEADGLEGRIEVKDGKVIFSNMNNLAIQHDVVVRVPVQVSYYWGVKQGSVAYYILTGDKKPANN